MLGMKQIFESIQNCSLRILFLRCNIFCQFRSYWLLLTFLNPKLLETRRIKFDLSFIFKLLNGLIDSNFTS